MPITACHEEEACQSGQQAKTALPRILLLNGPNLNMLGRRPSEHYGTKTLPELVEALCEYGQTCGMEVYALQSNSEGRLIDAIHEACLQATAGIIINAGAYTHTSYALRDALEIFDGPIVEVHLSQIDQREAWRRVSVIREVCETQYCGQDSYWCALDFLHARLSHTTPQEG